MSRWALVAANGTVDNVVLWDGDRDTWAPPDGFAAVSLDDSEPVGPGHALDGDADGYSYTPPPPADQDSMVDLRAELAGATSIAKLRDVVSKVLDVAEQSN